MATLEVSELFYSIQGESTFSGFPCVFIRLAGCNLRCTYCDARYSFEEEATCMSVEEILSYVSSYPNTLVELTGGEPLLQENTLFLLDELLKLKRNILIETNGSLDISTLPIDVTVIMDIKCPESGSSSSFYPTNFDHIKTRCALRGGSSEIKFVISSLKDYLWAKNLVLKKALHEFAPILFSPVKDRIQTKVLAEAILRDRLPVRLQLQLHTLLWPEIQRGV